MNAEGFNWMALLAAVAGGIAAAVIWLEVGSWMARRKWR